MSIVAGVALALMAHDLPYRLLWTIVGLTMILKGMFFRFSPDHPRQSVVEWCLSREEIDYRFWGLGLCGLAVVLLHALGWIGRI